MQAIISLTEIRQNNSSFVSQNSSVNNFKNESIKLPKITIPTFDGNYLEWLNFKDLFKSMVHDNESISKIIKYQYLKSLLSKSAADLIKHLPVSGSSYDEAWEKLEKRYDNKKHISSVLVNTFLEQNKINEPNGVKLRKLADVSDEVIRGLKALDDEANLRDLWLIHILLEKVDFETRKLWAQETTEIEFPTFEHFIEFLNNRCSYLDVSNPQSVNEVKCCDNVSNVKPNNLNNCLRCFKMHSLSKCYEFKAMPLSARKEFLRKNSLCYRCLNKHLIKNCVSKSVCEICKRPSHHSTLHEFRIDSNLTSVEDNSPDQAELLINSNVSFHAVNKKFVGLLPTAVVTVKDKEGKEINCTVLLDSASQCCFVTESFVRKLKLRRESARFSVCGIANSSAGMTKGSVKLSLTSKHNPNNKLSIEAFILNKLTNISNSDFNVDDLEYRDSVELADPNFNKAKNVDIIIGVDYFFAIIKTGQITCPENSLIAQNTLFGWVVAGKVPLSSLKKKSMISNYANIYDNENSDLGFIPTKSNICDNNINTSASSVNLYTDEPVQLNSQAKIEIADSFENIKSKSENPSEIQQVNCIDSESPGVQNISSKKDNVKSSVSSNLFRTSCVSTSLKHKEFNPACLLVIFFWIMFLVFQLCVILNTRSNFCVVPFFKELSVCNLWCCNPNCLPMYQESLSQKTATNVSTVFYNNLTDLFFFIFTIFFIILFHIYNQFYSQLR